MITQVGESGTRNVKRDAYVRIEPSDTLSISVETSLFDLFGKEIADEVTEVLREFDVNKASVTIVEKNAVNFVLQARVEDAVRKAIGEENEG
ncbi:MAG: citrate lyase ACP [Euryarchaeota archaeon]|nr:citrate lyase ACP [Euryarchaeota archaeon]